MPGVVSQIVGGLVGGIVGSIVLLMLMKMMGNIMPSPPKLLAKKMLGDENKGSMLLMMVMAVWGILYGVIAIGSLGYGITILDGVIFGLAPWLVMGLIMFPMNDYGFFGMSENKMLPMGTLVMHLIYGAVLAVVYSPVAALV